MGIARGPLYEAIRLMTGVDPWKLSWGHAAQHPEQWKAVEVITLALETLVAPDDEKRRAWLKSLPPLHKVGGIEQRRAFVVGVLQRWATDSEFPVRLGLNMADGAFAKLSDAELSAAQSDMQGNAERAFLAAGWLSLLCGAFGAPPMPASVPARAKAKDSAQKPFRKAVAKLGPKSTRIIMINGQPMSSR